MVGVLRSNCPNRERCGSTGHYFDGVSWKRCPCLEAELEKKILGIFACSDIPKKHSITKYLDDNLAIEGLFDVIKRPIASALRHLHLLGKNFASIDAYRLVEIYLSKDLDYSTAGSLLECDFLILFLGVGEIKNQRLPDMIVQALQRRGVSGKPTWVLMGSLSFPELASRYNLEVSSIINSYHRVKIE